MAVSDADRWAKIRDDSHDSDGEVNLSDFEVDLSETGR
jgi:hypothetical protein